MRSINTDAIAHQYPSGLTFSQGAGYLGQTGQQMAPVGPAPPGGYNGHDPDDRLGQAFGLLGELSRQEGAQMAGHFAVGPHGSFVSYQGSLHTGHQERSSKFFIYLAPTVKNSQSLQEAYRLPMGPPTDSNVAIFIRILTSQSPLRSLFVKPVVRSAGSSAAVDSTSSRSSVCTIAGVPIDCVRPS